MKKLLANSLNLFLALNVITVQAATYSYSMRVINDLNIAVGVFDGSRTVGTVAAKQTATLPFNNSGNSVHFMVSGQDICGKPGDPYNQLNLSNMLEFGFKKFHAEFSGSVKPGQTAINCTVAPDIE